MSSCTPIRHYTLTKQTQKWEKEHFDPDRPVARRKKASTAKKSNKSGKMTKRIG
jgi:hypothetical protein